jgi:hypothetical protein
VLAATTHEGALKAADLVLLCEAGAIASVPEGCMFPPGPLILLCLSDRQADAVRLRAIAHIAPPLEP